MARQNWYRESKTEQEQAEAEHEKYQYPTTNENKHNKNNINNKNTKQNLQQENKNKIKAVMFIPYTPGSELAKLLRENEEHLNKITNCKIKIVERACTKLQDLITKSDPWKGMDCSRQNCLLCLTKHKTEKNKNQDCHKRNIVYETRCLTCQQEENDKIDTLEVDDKKKSEL